MRIISGYFKGKKIIGLPAVSFYELKHAIRGWNSTNYDDVYLLILFPERYYCVEFKVNYYSGTNVISTKHYKPNLYFKVRR